MATLLAKEKRIDINSNLKRQGMRSDQAVVIKKIPIDTPKDIIVTAVSEFGEIKLIKIQLIGMWQKAIMEFVELDQANLIDLVQCEKCEKFGHSVLECNAPVVSPFKPSRTFKRVVSDEHHLQLAKLYEKKSVLISCPAAFNGKSWAQVVSLAGFSDGLHFASGSGSFFSGTSGVRVFTSGLDSRYLSASVVVVIDSSLAKHVCKISEVLSWLLSIRLLFKNKLLVSVLELYTGALSAVWFSQAGEINSFIAKAANGSSFIVLGGADNTKWNEFKEAMAANTAMFSDGFITSTQFLDLDASIVQEIVNSGVGFDCVHSAFFSVQKTYCASKLTKSLQAEKLRIRLAVDSQMENFAINKSSTIKSVLKHPFQKVVLDHLVVENELILEPDLVKAKVDMIMEGWTKKHNVMKNFSDDWSHQYQPLEYIFDDVFSNVMCSVDFNELLGMVFNLPDNKAAGFSGMSNELWKHCNKLVLDMLLVLLNFCLSHELVLGA
ncbi:hypothetical protein G9A89_009464 [Geosiphon pyriformis]|nr:hypothetical protein G9A89_009464 [Geosiphon pyriformis]